MGVNGHPWGESCPPGAHSGRSSASVLIVLPFKEPSSGFCDFVVRVVIGAVLFNESVFEKFVAFLTDIVGIVVDVVCDDTRWQCQTRLQHCKNLNPDIWHYRASASWFSGFLLGVYHSDMIPRYKDIGIPRYPQILWWLGLRCVVTTVGLIARLQRLVTGRMARRSPECTNMNANDRTKSYDAGTHRIAESPHDSPSGRATPTVLTNDMDACQRTPHSQHVLPWARDTRAGGVA